MKQQFHISKIILKSAGFEHVNEVFNGMEAFKHIEKGMPDIIF